LHTRAPRRELYSEKGVVLEERRLRVDNSPLGPFSEQFALRSLANNYRWVWVWKGREGMRGGVLVCLKRQGVLQTVGREAAPRVPSAAPAA
jgi:hypothetical protein